MTGDQPKLVCFDWGGVILRICKDFSEARTRAGLDPRSIRSIPDHARLYAQHRAEIVRAYEIGEISCEEYCDRISESIDGTYSPQEVGAIHDAWLIEEYEGAAELIEDLHAQGVQTALLSNTNHRHWMRQSPSRFGPAFPVASRLHHPHASHLLGHAKPDLAIFRSFESSTGFAPKDIIFFDDRADNIRAASAAGWRCEQIDPTLDPPGRIRETLAHLGLVQFSAA